MTGSFATVKSDPRMVRSVA